MTFPQTRLTLIRRLSNGGSDVDWRDFLDDYWPPLCAFAMRWGGLSLADAEDIAAETLQAIVKNQLLSRWQAHRAARLRTLLCSVARNAISNRARVEQGRNRILRGLAQRSEDDLPPSIWANEPSEEQDDTFYRAWIDDLLDRCVQSLLADLHRVGKGDCFRVLYGRLCEGLSLPEVAQMLQIPTATAENYYKAATKRLANELERAVRQHVRKYCSEGDEDDEFRAEWTQISAYLKTHGGIENAVRSCHQRMTSAERPSRDSKTLADTAATLIAAMHK
jgi:RNA polymerase sigma factor (sigma-70 family)